MRAKIQLVPTSHSEIFPWVIRCSDSVPSIRVREEFMESFYLELGSSWWWYALVLIVLGLVSTWYYAVHRRSLQPRQRAVLTLLRWLGLASLVTSLFVPVARFVSVMRASIVAPLHSQ